MSHASAEDVPDAHAVLWIAAFTSAVNGCSDMTDEDYALARRLREADKPPAYAAARVRLRIRNRRLLAAVR